MQPITLFKCLADDTRLKAVLLIQSEGELCVCELTSALETSQPKVSRQAQQHDIAEGESGHAQFEGKHPGGPINRFFVQGFKMSPVVYRMLVVVRGPAHNAPTGLSLRKTPDTSPD